MTASVPSITKASPHVEAESSCEVTEDIADDEADIAYSRSLLAPLVATWFAAVVLRLLCAAQSEEPWIEVQLAFEVPAVYVMAACLAGWIYRSVPAALQLAKHALSVMAAVTLVRLVLMQFGPALDVVDTDIIVAFGACINALVYLLMNRSYFTNRLRSVLMLIAFGLGAVASVWTAELNMKVTLYALSQGAEEQQAREIESIAPDRLWQSQHGLVEQSAKLLSAASSEEGRVYLIAVAPDGTQELFVRESRRALEAFGSRFGDNLRMSVLLSNDGASPTEVPLATNPNLEQIAQVIAEDADPARDMLAVYLTSHGSEDAALSTYLPDYTALEGITAPRLRSVLAKTGVAKRLVVVSACYSGSWIAPLASDDSIVITAARKDRTSYGCDDSREMTVFAEMFFKGDAVETKPLEHAFKEARERIAADEAGMAITPSEPQVHVGKNMRGVWETQPE
ncbi:C13 family peptidase [Qipengyuania polymorpha]|nr:C13 family peptidase [Qipengyuania polymorpha]